MPAGTAEEKPRAGSAAGPDERLDNTGFGNLSLIQRPGDFCYGIDAVILADFAARSINSGQRAVTSAADLGTGTGIIPLILSHKTEVPRIVGIEIQEKSLELAVRNVEMNGLSGRIAMLGADVADIARGHAEEALALSVRGDADRSRAAGYDVVVTNPPYVAGGGGLKSGTDAKTIARHETSASLDDFAAAAAVLLKDRGDLFMVHRPSRLVDIFEACRNHGLEPKEMRLVRPREGEAANIVLIHAVKGGGTELKALDTLTVYGPDGGYTAEIDAIYERNGSV